MSAVAVQSARGLRPRLAAAGIAVTVVVVAYFAAMTSQAAIAELGTGAGRRFDPELVPIFIRLVENDS